MEAKIAECQTLAELSTLERLYMLSEYEQGLLFERKVEIICRTAEWGMENEQYEEMNDEPLLQTGRGRERSIDEVNDGAGTSDEVSNNFFTMADVKQVRVKKFNATGMDYTVQFTNMFSQLELSEFHDRLHEIFERLRNAVTKRYSCA